MIIRDKIIKLLGGYTKKEYIRIENKYQALLDSKTNDKSAMIVNEYLCRMLADLRKYAQYVLYGLPNSVWARKMYNVINNNYLRLVVRYSRNSSSIPYRIDTTLDEEDQFVKILRADNVEDIEKVISSILETD